MKIVLVLAAAMLLGGCATMRAEQQQVREEFQRTIPTCEGKEMCDVLWERAQLWVVQNAGMKIQTVTNVLIETYNSVGSSTSLGMRVIKEPMGGDRYRLVITTGCANMFGCVPDSWGAAQNFNSHINGVKYSLLAEERAAADAGQQ